MPRGRARGFKTLSGHDVARFLALDWRYLAELTGTRLEQNSTALAALLAAQVQGARCSCADSFQGRVPTVYLRNRGWTVWAPPSLQMLFAHPTRGGGRYEVCTCRRFVGTGLVAVQKSKSKVQSKRIMNKDESSSTTPPFLKGVVEL